MIEKIWFHRHPLGWLLAPLLWPLSLIFKIVSRHRRQRYQSGQQSTYRAPVPVIVVGNITAGGNGKTPVVIWLVEMLQSLGFKPGVVSRGYGGKAEHYPLLVQNDTPSAQSGDEPLLIKRRTGAPVAVDPVRSQAVKALLEQDVDIVVTDDGLQHYALERDIELVVIDGQRRFGNQYYIPFGPLREGLERLSDVDFLITNGGNAQQGEIAMTLAPSDAVNLKTGERKPVQALKQLVAFAGIGHPPRFFNTLNDLEADVVKTQAFADHQTFEPSELSALAKQGQHLIMTEKDAVKCYQYAQDNWWYLPVSANINESDTQNIIQKIIEVKAQYGSPST
ncbi:tetraacyldisaccharide 4'-kinase [Vibrio casei]|uniref:Tetraacyldisaccharide 4'-kinase n=1 Tax=Vibrio casei TaxID=673372 RepID=A0A368LNQ6_9VIBR|nr:tetraacyldisaccharide 4'-kinase [Vibrio casei]RCS73455.1 tetraacyldisaccharide 4'-kinase [Vibrio casei]SJN22453.1 Tetraacyldisaccharide 4'-kinase [Vibrio casei]